METNGIRFGKYVKEYKWSNVLAMLKNNTKEPHRCTEMAQGKVVVISGATSGIGRAAARKYASMGTHVVCINRNKQKSEALKQEIEADYHVPCDYFIADLSMLEDVHHVAQTLLAFGKPIDVLIHNAGVFLTTRELTQEGIEKVFMVHHLAPFIINYILKDSLITQDKARIILVNSEGHRFAAWGLRLDDLNWSKRRYGGLKSYGSAKLAQLLTMMGFNDAFSGTGVTINAMHPGAVKTETGQENGTLYKWYKRTILDKTLKSTSIAAEALYYLGVSKEVETTSGLFYNLTTPEIPAPPALDREVAPLIWDISVKMGKLE